VAADARWRVTGATRGTACERRLLRAGIAIGLVGAIAASRFIGALLFGVARNDPSTYAAVVLLLLAISLLACGVPAWRAARVDPARTLRA
jgi:putative ABC transport system permease protein